MSTQTPPPTDRPAPANPFAPRRHGRLVPVADSVFVWRNIVNSGVVVGSRAAAVVDTQVNQALARRLRDDVRRRFDVPLRYAINTHYHWDHTAGNAVFAEAGCELIAGRRTAEYMVAKAPRQKGFLASRGFDLGPDPRQPDRYADEIRRIDLGGVSLELVDGHPAETNDATLVWCPERRVLIAGDTVMTGSFPILGQPSQREGLENADWLRALDQVRGFEPAAILTGHGPVADLAAVDRLGEICRYFLDTVRAHYRAGRDLAATIAAVETDLPAWMRAMPEVWGTPRYAVLRVWAGCADLGEPGWQHVKPSAVPRAAAEADLSGGGGFAAWRERIAACREGGDAPQAVSLAEMACRAFEDDPRVWTLYGDVLIEASRGVASVLEKGDCFELARRTWDRARRLDPTHGPAMLAEGRFLVMMALRNGEDPARGLRWLDAAEAAGSLDVRANAELAFHRGIAHRCRGEEADAKRCFEAALATDPSYPAPALALRADGE